MPGHRKCQHSMRNRRLSGCNWSSLRRYLYEVLYIQTNWIPGISYLVAAHLNRKLPSEYWWKLEPFVLSLNNTKFKYYFFRFCPVILIHFTGSLQTRWVSCDHISAMCFLHLQSMNNCQKFGNTKYKIRPEPVVILAKISSNFERFVQGVQDRYSFSCLSPQRYSTKY